MSGKSRPSVTQLVDTAECFYAPSHGSIHIVRGQDRLPHRQPYVIDGRSFPRYIDVPVDEDGSPFSADDVFSYSEEDDDSFGALLLSWFGERHSAAADSALLGAGWRRTGGWSVDPGRLVTIDRDPENPQVEKRTEKALFRCEVGLPADVFLGQPFASEETTRVVESGIASDSPAQPQIVLDALETGHISIADAAWWGCADEAEYLRAVSGHWAGTDIRPPCDAEAGPDPLTVRELEEYVPGIGTDFSVLAAQHQIAVTGVLTRETNGTRSVGVTGWCPDDVLVELLMEYSIDENLFVDNGIPDVPYGAAAVGHLRRPRWVPAALPDDVLNCTEAEETGTAAVMARQGLRRFRMFRRQTGDGPYRVGVLRDMARRLQQTAEGY